MQGKTINGYTLTKLLGTGGMAEVWLAENSIGKYAAVKILLSKFCNDEVVVARFQNEAKVMVQLDHPNIRQVYDFGKIDDRPCILMEYLEGNDLKSLLKKGTRFKDEELRKWWNQIVDALNYTHSKGIVHRDIKPSNLFLDKKGNIKLLDFGIAKIKESISNTATGSMLGTLVYMSPEQVEDSKRIDYRSDIYSLAVTFVHLLTRKAPYDNTTTSDYAIRKGIVEIPLDLSMVPEDWQGFLAPYLAKNPDDRPELRPFEAVRLEENPESHDEADVDDGTLAGDAPSSVKSGYRARPKKAEKPKKEREAKPKEKPVRDSFSGGSKKKGVKKWLLIAGIVVAVAVVGALLLFPNQYKSIDSDLDYAEAYLNYIPDEPIDDYSDAVYWLDASYSASSLAKDNLIYMKGAYSSKRWYKRLHRCEEIENRCCDMTMGAIMMELQRPDYDKDPFAVLKRVRQLEGFYEAFMDRDSSYLSYYLDEIENQINEKVGGKLIVVKNVSEGVEGEAGAANEILFIMKLVEGGSFWMGSEKYNAKPVHSVTLSDFYIGETEVTQALWKAVMNDNPSKFKGDSLPVEQVSFVDCEWFISRLNELTGKEFRLPTEAEWEYAARGGQKSKGYKYAGSDNQDDVAWFLSNSGHQTHEVKTKAPNELGLYDMSGNVIEWCRDNYHSYEPNPQTNPCFTDGSNVHINRGGGYMAGSEEVTCRWTYASGARYPFLGLRLVLSKE